MDALDALMTGLFFWQCLAAIAAEGVEATNQKAFLKKNDDVCIAEEATQKVSPWPI